MSERKIHEPTHEIPVKATHSWESQPSYANIENILALRIDLNRWQFVHQGDAFDIETSSEKDDVASDGFSSCSALIIHDLESDGYSFVHVLPFDDAIYDALRERPRGPSEALFIFGSESLNQPDIEKLLKKQGMEVNSLHIDTGNRHFGVALKPSTGQVSVVRRYPDQSIFQYQPFKSVTK